MLIHSQLYGRFNTEITDHFAKTNSTLTPENEEKSRKTAVFRICIHCDRKTKQKTKKS